MRKEIGLYLLSTFLIMAVCWGSCLLASCFGITLSRMPLLYAPYLIGGFSPTIGSFLTHKLCNGHSFLKWLRLTFDFRQSFFSYLLLILFAAFFFVPLCLLSGYDHGAPLIAVLFMLPMMLFGGGLEECGWRGLLQPALECKFGFTLGSLFTAIIWSVWHLPLFFISGVSQYGDNFAVFSLNILGLSFSMAAIKKCTGSTWLCVVLHCLVNSLHGVYVIHENYVGSIITAAIMVVMSYLLLWMKTKKPDLF